MAVSIGSGEQSVLLLTQIDQAYPEGRALKQREVFQMGVDWVRDGRVNMKTLITHELPLSEVKKGLWLCRERPDETIKVVIHI